MFEAGLGLEDMSRRGPTTKNSDDVWHLMGSSQGQGPNSVPLSMTCRNRKGPMILIIIHVMYSLLSVAQEVPFLRDVAWRAGGAR